MTIETMFIEKAIKWVRNKIVKTKNHIKNEDPIKEKDIKYDDGIMDAYDFVSYCNELLIYFDANDEDWEEYDMIYFDED